MNTLSFSWIIVGVAMGESAVDMEGSARGLLFGGGASGDSSGKGISWSRSSGQPWAVLTPAPL